MSMSTGVLGRSDRFVLFLGWSARLPPANQRADKSPAENKTRIVGDTGGFQA